MGAATAPPENEARLRAQRAYVRERRPRAYENKKPGPYIVGEAQIQRQLQEAYTRLVPCTPYRKVTTLHLIWDTELDIRLRQAGSLELGHVFSQYGYTTRHERIPTFSNQELDSHARECKISAWFWELIRELKHGTTKDDLIMVHYRGDSNAKGIPTLACPKGMSFYLKSGPIPGHAGCAVCSFRDIKTTLDSSSRAQIVYLLDTDYVLPSQRYGYATTPILAAAVRGANEDPIPGGDHFNETLVSEFEKALYNRKYHSLSTLYSAMCQAGKAPFATRAYFSNTNDYHPLDKPSPFFCPQMTDVAIPSAFVQMAIAPTMGGDALDVAVRVKCPLANHTANTEYTTGLQGISSTLGTWLSSRPTSCSERAGALSSLIIIKGTTPCQEWLRLKMSRALWHALPPFRGWAQEVDGQIADEGDCSYYEKELHMEQWTLDYDVSDDEIDVTGERLPPLKRILD